MASTLSRIRSASVAVLAAGMCLTASGTAQESAPPAPPPPNAPVILVTGSTGGLGREVARRLAGTGAHVIVHGRNVERGTALVREIEAEGIGSARFYRADLASFAEVRRLAREIGRDYPRLDVLVNNAGVWLEGRRLSQDGQEMHFQVNYLSGYLLTRLLLPLLIESAPARIVNVASRLQVPIDFDDITYTNDFDDIRAYGRSKLAQVMFSFSLAEELGGTGVSVLAVHPATQMNTDLVVERGATPQSTVEEGAQVVVHVVTAPGLGTGRFYNQLEPARAHEQAYDAGARAQLMSLSAAITGAGGHE